MKNPWVVVLVVMLVLFGVAFTLSSLSTQKSNEGVVIEKHTKVGSNPVVTLHEYSDFQCPACATFQPVVDSLLQQHGDHIAFEYHHFPLTSIHSHALEASVAAEAAGLQGKFFEFSAILFAKQSEWAAASLPQTYFIKYATDLGLDKDQFSRQLRSTMLREAVHLSEKEAMSLKLSGTPTFFLNGEEMHFSTYEQFVSQITSAINEVLTATTTPTMAVGE